MHVSYFLCPTDPRPAQRADETDDDHEPDRAMDIDEERDFADQGPLTDMNMEEDAGILSLLLKHMPSCIDAADIEQLVKDIPVQPPVVVPVRTVQEAVAAGGGPGRSRSLDGEEPFVSGLSTQQRWYCVDGIGPAECVGSVKRHWLHPHPVGEGLQRGSAPGG
jgi:hypothetical protein